MEELPRSCGTCRHARIVLKRTPYLHVHVVECRKGNIYMEICSMSRAFPRDCPDWEPRS